MPAHNKTTSCSAMAYYRCRRGRIFHRKATNHFLQMNTLIKNARLLNEGQIKAGDLLIKGQRIEKISGDISAQDARVVDANGCLLMPGMIDDQVHFREPGLEHKANLATESRAAVAGGITSFMEMPNTQPFAATESILNDKIARAGRVSVANFGFYLGASSSNLEDIKSLKPGLACGLKVFMGATTGSILVDDPEYLARIFASTPMLIATHCEDTPMIQANEEKARERYGEAVPITEHPNIRSREACLKSSTLAVDLAKKTGARLHVLHLTTADELSLFEAGDRTKKQITVEACVHHLLFNSDDYDSKGNMIKCNPAIKSKRDQDALLQAVRDDVIDVIATDHAPHTREEKNRPFLKAPAGLPLVQHALQTLFEQVKRGQLSTIQVIDKVCHAPADLFHVRDRGYLREGYYADLVLVDDQTSYVVDNEPVLAKCGWTPFAGMTFTSRILGTWVNGRQLWSNDEGLMETDACGQPLEYDRAT